MRSQVTVTWGEPATYRFDLEDQPTMPNDQARAWLDGQFTALECEPIRLTGKVLTADKILSVAQAAGQSRFRDAGEREWALAFARATSGALGKPVVTVDLATMSLGY
ncbi:MAG: hypothetical protein JNK17_09350 [Hydrogenophaga sp.]|uniref:hypothetical protein n=1 Tax=Hydrogenophaga sp. TaxID=1904254 RepID=UPI001A603195|nr:hypothetical protein [Hydrogenophaga sp.]